MNLWAGYHLESPRIASPHDQPRGLKVSIRQVVLDRLLLQVNGAWLECANHSITAMPPLEKSSEGCNAMEPAPTLEGQNASKSRVDRGAA